MFNFVKKTAKSAKRATAQINGNKKNIAEARLTELLKTLNRVSLDKDAKSTQGF